MSEYHIISTAAPPPPQVPTNFTTDVFNDTAGSGDGTVNPALNKVEVRGRDTTQDNDNGIRTDADPNLGKFLYVELTNRASGQINTTDDTPTTIITFPLGATPGVYTIDGSIQGYNITDTEGGSYTFNAGIRTTGAAGIELGSQFQNVFEEGGMEAAEMDVDVSGNNAIIIVQGLPGKTIHWNAFFTYRFVS